MGGLDKNGGWVLLVYAIAGAVLLLTVILTIRRTQARKAAVRKLEKEN